LNHFSKVKLVEQTEKFIETAKIDFANEGLLDRLEFKVCGLQDFNPEKGEFDLIWCQWVLSHLTDDDLVSFLKRCKDSLIDGYIGLKENVAAAGIIYDNEDSSCTRSDILFRNIFDQAGLQIVKESTQTGFPTTLYPVKMYLLK
jgi:protein N-terminal methyltransferase